MGVNGVNLSFSITGPAADFASPPIVAGVMFSYFRTNYDGWDPATGVGAIDTHLGLGYGQATYE